MPFFGSRRRGAVDVAVVDEEIERAVSRIVREAPVDRAAGVADGHVPEIAVEGVVENRHREQAQTPRPWDEHGADHDQGDAGLAIEVLLDVELARSAGAAGGYGSLQNGKRSRVRGFAAIAADLARDLGGEPGLAAGAEEVDRGHPGPS